MKKQTAFFFYAIGFYVVLQFAWWGFHLIQLTEELKKEPSETNKHVVMIIGEGLVFFVLLIAGLWKVRNSIKKELQLSQQQNNFLLSVTHELKTPLTANKLYLQTIRKRNPDLELRNELVDKAIQENERLEAMIDNILNATRLENNALKPVKTEMDVSGLFRQICERTQKRHHLQFINCNLEEHVLFPADSFFIETILTNLIENAIKYAGTNLPITVSLKKVHEGILFSVSDLGPGIKKEEQKSIFRKFYRPGNEETRSQKGSGLGLFIVSELTRIHHGHVTYKENTPSGSIFEILLTP